MSDAKSTRRFKMRGDGYDPRDVDTYVVELLEEVESLKRSLGEVEKLRPSDRRLHDPEGAVKRTLAIAQETADRLIYDAQQDAERRRSDASEHALETMADAETRAARMLAEVEEQTAQVRENGLAAARSAIKVEREKALAEVAQIRRVRNDLRAEALELRSGLDRYRSQARNAADSLVMLADGPLLGDSLPDYVDDEIILAGIDEDEILAGASIVFKEPTKQTKPAPRQEPVVQKVVEEPAKPVAKAVEEAPLPKQEPADPKMTLDASIAWSDSASSTETATEKPAEVTQLLQKKAETKPQIADVVALKDTSGNSEKVETAETAETVATPPQPESPKKAGGVFSSAIASAKQDSQVEADTEEPGPITDTVPRTDRFLAELRELSDNGDDD